MSVHSHLTPGRACKQGGGRWREFRRGERCPVCGKLERCKAAPDGTAVMCFRVESGRPCQGNVAWVHQLDDRRDLPPPPPAPPPDPETARAPDDVLHRAHRAILARLGLAARHRDALLARGLTPTDVRIGEYRTLPADNRPRWDAARAAADAAGGWASGVPCLAPQTSRAGNPYYTLGGRPGLLVPVRDLGGRIVGLLVRPDAPGEGGKYVWAWGGVPSPRNAARVHVPVGTTPPADGTAVVVEGALKADVARRLSLLVRPCPTAPWCVLGLPGVTCWERAVPALKALGVRRAIVAFDADLVTNARVEREARKTLAGLLGTGFAVGMLSWGGEPKGLDDALVAGAAIHLTEVPRG